MRRLASLVGLGLGLGLGCSPSTRTEPPAPPPTSPAAEAPVCPEAKDPLRPLVIGWPATLRAELETAAAAGPVVVSYAGCVLKVLPTCRLGGAAYGRRATTPTEKNLELRSVRELHADLPLGVAGLAGRLEEGRGLSVSYVTVGVQTLEHAPEVLEGDCAGATHYVESMVLGAFSVAALHTASAAASVRVAGASAAGAASSSEQESGASGDVATCRAQGWTAGAPCRAVLGLGLRPLRRRSRKAEAAGFGVGLVSPAVVPPLSPLSIAPAAEELTSIDVTLLELLQAALKADRSEALSSVARAEAWDRVATYAPAGPSSPYGALALRRRDQWLARVPAEKARAAQIVTLCPRHRADQRKLARLLRLAPNVLAENAKEAFRRELAEAYAPWPELAECTVLEAASAAEAAWPALHGADDGMVHIPGGTFEMGSSAREDHATPVHVVTVGDFDIDATEVTVEAYARCQRAGVCSPRSSHADEAGWRCNALARGESRDLAPANCMTFAQAETYCRWAGKRLPTEEEWEYAARGTDGRTYPWGEWSKNDDGYPVFAHTFCAVPGSEIGYRVGSLAKNASAFGVRDMAGSVWEWTSGRYAPSYDTASTTRARVLRGGEFGWSSEPDCRPYGAAYRLGRDPRDADSNLGARCARAGRGGAP